jgi:Icc protein
MVQDVVCNRHEYLHAASIQAAGDHVKTGTCRIAGNCPEFWGQSKVKIIQLSDCHISADPDAVYRGINPREMLRALLPAVRSWGPELVLITGDLAEDASEGAYAFLRQELDRIEAPVLTIPGNHDDAGLQSEAFADTPVLDPLSRISGGWKLVLLNSAVAGRIAGELTERMLAGLRAELETAETPVLVAVHHQPVPTASPWIDRYPLEQPERFWSVVDAQPLVRAVIWGHIHHDYRARRGGVDLLGAPSTAANSRPESGAFVADGAGPACRWINLEPDGGLDCGLLRPAGSGLGQDQPEEEIDQDAGEGRG